MNASRNGHLNLNDHRNHEESVGHLTERTTLMTGLYIHKMNTARDIAYISTSRIYF